MADALGLVDASESTNDNKDTEESCHAADVDITTTEAGHQEPGENNANSADATGLEVELNRVTHESATTKGLGGVSNRGNLSSSQIATHEAVPVVGSGRVLLLHLVGSLEKLNLRISVKGNITLGDERKNGSLGILVALLADKPPGRLGSENGTKHDEWRPSPLQSKGNSNSGTDELTNDPAKVDVGSKVWAQDNGRDVGSIGECEGLEDTPWKTEENVSGEEDVEVGRKEGEEDESDHEHLRSHHGLLVTEVIRNPTVDVETDDLTTHATDLDISVEATKKTQIITFHDDRSGEQQRKGNGLGIQAETIAQSKIMLAIIGLARSRLLNLVETHLGVRIDMLNLSKVVLWGG
ncbi:hypothetical protein HG531_012432 [Fusarium graminearum]|nr:hypothetical protein HG531_012432 [Fusarium graminearum]